ncbi:SUKH-3 domain-containing protein [Pendulispora albinea]|uniref:SUKH-3 domain-containing protein n=1 Tax=Pendulispora albinea TaxID=2741071 RepID=A0ABZ2M6U4_9BACT
MIDDTLVRETLMRAGWVPGRRDEARANEWAHQLDSPGGLQIFDAARAALAEFGGLKVDVVGPGIDFAKTSFELDPLLAIGEEDRFEDAASQLARRVYPLGDVGGGHAFLAIDDRGAVYFINESGPTLLGHTIENALAALIQGRNKV